MTLITEEYRELNRKLHEDRADYGTTAAKFTGQIGDIITALSKNGEAVSILDYGCGKGLLGKALSHLMIAEYDPAIPGKDEAPEPADFVVAVDVLEHIEPDCLDAVLDDIQGLAKRAVFFTVETSLAEKFLADGRNAHLIQEQPEWWLQRIMARWQLRLFQSIGSKFAVLALAKKGDETT